MIILPETGYLRLSQIVGNSKTNPPISPLIPIGKSTWWSWVKSGKAPAPIKIGPRTTVWKIESIRNFINGGSNV